MSDAVIQLVAAIIIGLALAGWTIFARYRASQASTPEEREAWTRLSEVSETVAKAHNQTTVARIRAENNGTIPADQAAAVKAQAVADVKNNMGPAMLSALEKTLGGEAPASQAIATVLESKVDDLKRNSMVMTIDATSATPQASAAVSVDGVVELSKAPTL